MGDLLGQIEVGCQLYLPVSEVERAKSYIESRTFVSLGELVAANINKLDAICRTDKATTTDQCRLKGLINTQGDIIDYRTQLGEEATFGGESIIPDWL